MYLSFFILTIGVVVASYVVWRAFRREQFDEQRTIDILLITIVFALGGARLGNYIQGINFYTVFIETLYRMVVDDIIILCTVIVSLLCVSLFLWYIKWPVWESINFLSFGAVVFEWFYVLNIALTREIIALYPQLRSYFTIELHAPFVLILFTGILFVIYRFRHTLIRTQNMFWIFLLTLPSFTFLLTGSAGWLIMKGVEFIQMRRLSKNI